MNKRKKVLNVLPNCSLTCFLIPSLFSKKECGALLNKNIKRSFELANINYPTYYRNNERVVLDDKELAEMLFEKVSSYLPKTITICKENEAENGVWNLNQLNDRIRFCKYSANQYFNRHLDGVYYKTDSIQSKLTFMIYLNSATSFKGGRTLFYKNKDTTEILASYIPRQGDLIVFDHNLWHEGELLTEGVKYVLRSDILYSKKKEHAIVKPFYGHLGYIWSLLKLSSSLLVSGGRDKEIKVWNKNGALKKSLVGHRNSILHIEKIAEDLFISCSRDKEIIVWRKFEIINRINIHKAVVLSVCRLSDKYFATSSGDSTIKICCLDGTVLQTLIGHKNWVWKVIALKRNYIASCSEDNTINIWNYKLVKIISTFSCTCSITALIYKKNSNQIISGNLNGELTIRKLNSVYKEVNSVSFKGHDGIIRTIKQINNRYFATGGEDNKVKIWNFKGELFSTLEHQNFVQSIEVLNDTSIISASYDGTIKIWKIF